MRWESRNPWPDTCTCSLCKVDSTETFPLPVMKLNPQELPAEPQSWEDCRYPCPTRPRTWTWPRRPCRLRSCSTPRRYPAPTSPTLSANPARRSTLKRHGLARSPRRLYSFSCVLLIQDSSILLNSILKNLANGLWFQLRYKNLI